MAKIIGFNADERMKLMAGALASRLGFADVSSMMRALLEEKVEKTFSKEEREQIIRLLSPGDNHSSSSENPAIGPSKVEALRTGPDVVAEDGRGKYPKSEGETQPEQETLREEKKRRARKK